MPKSQLKKLKASLHAERTARGGRIQKQAQTPNKRPETVAQRADRIRRETLLPELQRRNKVGGVLDRRIGENDPSLAPEDRDLQRYAALSSRVKKADVFNLEDESGGGFGDDGDEQLTHLGRPVKSDRGGRMIDDYAESHDDDDEGSGDELFSKSKRKLEDAVDEITRAQDEGADGQPERKKSKKEVMEEVIAKSKLHRYERQKANEEDEDVREELDRALPDLMAALRGDAGKEKQKPNGAAITGNGSMHPDRAGLLHKTSQDPNREYDQRLRQLASDKRAQPTQRTKTAEEKAEEDAQKLKELEDGRQRRMNGEIEDEESEDDQAESKGAGHAPGQDDYQSEDDAADFGFQSARPSAKAATQPELDVEDEDDFVIDEELIGSVSELDSGSDAAFEDELDEPEPKHDKMMDDADAEFLKDVLPASEKERSLPLQTSTIKEGSSLAYTYPCPQNHTDLLQVFGNLILTDLPTVVQRIRALYHSSLAAENKTKLPAFASTLVDHITYLSNRHQSTDTLSVVESLIRHIHSMSRTYPTPIAAAFRSHLERIHAAMSADSSHILEAGDLTVLTAIGTIYPTSDHFHQVVTPAITLIARWLGTVLPSDSSTVPGTTSLTGAYLVALCIRYQRLARRYIPETIRFTVQALNRRNKKTDDPTLAIQHINNLTALSSLWKDTAAVIEIFEPTVLPTLHRLARTPSTPKSKPPHISTTDPTPQPSTTTLKKTATAAYTHLTHLLRTAHLTRRPLLLHAHPPLPIKTSLPLFEPTFHPSKHYDPDPSRALSSKLRKEHQREKKGAMRELRRDSEFVGREKLKERKERERAYEEKMRRLVGGIEREEGEGKRAYERVREKRKKRF